MVVGSWVSSNTKDEDIGSGGVDVAMGDGVGLFAASVTATGVTLGATVVVGTMLRQAKRQSKCRAKLHFQFLCLRKRLYQYQFLYHYLCQSYRGNSHYRPQSH
jgi:hypothetical protein